MIQINEYSNYITQDNVFSVCFCWEITRRDGNTLRFTNHDLSLIVEGNTYKAVNSIDVSATQRQQNLNTTNKEFRGFLAQGELDPDDIRDGLYDNSEIRELTVDWRRPFNGPIIEQVYIITNMTFNQTYWEAKIEDRSNKLKNEVGLVSTKSCLNSFGDERCKYQVTKSIHSITQTTGDVTVYRGASLNGQPVFTPVTFTLNPRNQMLTDYFPNGGRQRNTTIRFITGNNVLTSYDAFTSESYFSAPNSGAVRLAILTIFDPLIYDVIVGDEFELGTGCDKTLEKCSQYDNVKNFRGMPYIPGSDVILRREDS